jgi:glycosyltransferase involved in cell wall biosynthesis
MIPKISIVFTSYNHKEYLKQALDGLMNQSFKDFELIIIDDCSTDDSQETLMLYTGDPRVKLHLLDKNTGSYVNSSNLGASYATADYIIFAQCDDVAESNLLEALYNVISQNQNIGVVFSRSRLIDQANNFITIDYEYQESKFKKHCSQDCLITGRQMIDFLSQACVIPNLSAAMIRRDLYVKIGGLSTDFKVLADWNFWLEAANITDFFYIANCLNNFRQHNNTIRSNIRNSIQIHEIFTMMNRFQKSNNVNAWQHLRFQKGFSVIWFENFLIRPKDCLKEFSNIFFQASSENYIFPVIFFFTIIGSIPRYTAKLFMTVVKDEKL